MVAICPYRRVVECHFQFIHGFQQQTLCFIVKIFKRCLLLNGENRITTITVKLDGYGNSGQMRKARNLQPITEREG